MELKSKFGQLNVYNDRVEIIKTMGSKKSAFGDKTIFLNQISGIVIKEYTFLSPGYIHFSATGDISSPTRRAGVFNAIQDENTFIFNKEDIDFVKEIKSKIEELLSYQSKSNEQPISQPISNDPDLIRKYKKLFDDGIITKEEYDLKKREILGL